MAYGAPIPLLMGSGHHKYEMKMTQVNFRWPTTHQVASRPNFWPPVLTFGWEMAQTGLKNRLFGSNAGHSAFKPLLMGSGSQKYEMKMA